MASSCCLLQLGLFALSNLGIAHVGCAGFNKVLGPVRLPLRFFMFLWLGGSWARLRRLSCCEAAPAAPIGTQESQEKTGAAACGRKAASAPRVLPAPSAARTLAWRTALTLFIAFLPEALEAVGSHAMAGAAGEPLPAPLLGGTGVARVDLDVGGMGCEACQLYVQNAIASAPGVLRCTADWRKGTATVWMQNEELTDTGAAAPIPLNVSMLSETFAKGEYTLRLASKPEQAPEKTPPSAASGAYAYVSSLVLGGANAWRASLTDLDHYLELASLFNGSFVN